MKQRWILGLMGAPLAAAVALAARHGKPDASCVGPPDIPQSIREEHHEIRAGLDRAVLAGGRVGAAARELDRLLRPHFEREEQVALPPLGALRPLANREPAGELLGALAPSDTLARELPDMLGEHVAIRAAVERLKTAAERDGNPAVRGLADQLALHALTEEEVLYPAAVLVGDLLRERIRREGITVPCVLLGAN